jgi:hypothetical protein
MSEKFLPIFMKIDWGDGSYNTYDNDVFVKSRDKINIFKISPILTNTYIKEYYPSDSALYKNLTAQILIEYSNGDHTWVTIPINIRSYDYFESIYDLNIVNTNILPVSSNSLAYQLKTSEGGFIIELSN